MTQAQADKLLSDRKAAKNFADGITVTVLLNLKFPIFTLPVWSLN